MTVSLTISKTVNGSAVADTLAGGSSGINEGTATQDSTTTNVTTYYMSHNGASAITDLSYYAVAYTGTYGGDFSAAADFVKLKAHGDTGSNVYGLQVNETYNDTTWASYYTVKTGQADSYANRRQLPTTAMTYNNSGSDGVPSVPVAGSVGPTSNHVLGDRAKFKSRYVVPSTETVGGTRQHDWVLSYNYTT